ncbi:hypothetical protein D3C72_60110 [compost metagenome]
MKPGPLSRLAAALSLALTLVISPMAQAAFLDEVPGGAINWTDGVIEVTGTGVMPETGSLAQKRMMGYRAAIADAYRKLAEAVDGVRVDAVTSVSNYVTDSDVVRTQVGGLIKGAQVGKAVYNTDGSVAIKLTLDLHGKNRSVASIVVPAQQQAVESAAGASTSSSVPTTSYLWKTVRIAPAAPIPVTEDYSGVIIDAKGLSAEPALTPQLFDESGTELYPANIPADADAVIDRGIVSYAKSVDEAKTLTSRIGKKPLVIKAKAVRGPLKADLVLDHQAAGLLLGADQRRAFLNSFNVVIVL